MERECCYRGNTNFCMTLTLPVVSVSFNTMVTSRPSGVKAVRRVVRTDERTSGSNLGRPLLHLIERRSEKTLYCSAKTCPL